MVDSPKPHRLVADFMIASSPLEKHLQEGGPLTDSEASSVEVTLVSLKLFLDSWKRKHGKT